MRFRKDDGFGSSQIFDKVPGKSSEDSIITGMECEKIKNSFRRNEK